MTQPVTFERVASVDAYRGFMMLFMAFEGGR